MRCQAKIHYEQNSCFLRCVCDLCTCRDPSVLRRRPKESWGLEVPFLVAPFGGDEGATGSVDQRVGAAEGGVHRLQDGAELLVILEGFQHQEAAQHHGLEAPLIKTG